MNPVKKVSKNLAMIPFMVQTERLLNDENIYIPGIVDSYRYYLSLLPKRVTKEAFIDKVNFVIQKRGELQQDSREVWLMTKHIKKGKKRYGKR